MNQNCANCNLPKLIVNKKFNLCDDCNFIRTHNGRTKFEVSQEKHKIYIEKQQKKAIERLLAKPSNPSKPIKQQTSKEASIKTKLALLKREIELESVQNNEYYCKGCGNHIWGLIKAILLSIGQYKHLELVKENIQLLCRQCHSCWESSDIYEMVKLNCFEENLEIIKKLDEVAYNKLNTKYQEYKENYFLKNN